MTALESRFVLQFIADAAENGADTALTLAIAAGLIPAAWHTESEAWRNAVTTARERA